MLGKSWSNKASNFLSFTSFAVEHVSKAVAECTNTRTNHMLCKVRKRWDNAFIILVLVMQEIYMYRKCSKDYSFIRPESIEITVS